MLKFGIEAVIRTDIRFLDKKRHVSIFAEDIHFVIQKILNDIRRIPFFSLKFNRLAVSNPIGLYGIILKTLNTALITLIAATDKTQQRSQDKDVIKELSLQ